MAVKVHWMEHEPNTRELEYHFTGLSTDEKPNSKRVAVNSLFLELDTGDFYYLKSPFVEGTETKEDIYDGVLTGEYYEERNCYFTNVQNFKIDTDSIDVAFDNIKYVVSKNEGSEPPIYYEYGAPQYSNGCDFSEYPFHIESEEEDDEWGTFFAFKDSGEHTIVISKNIKTEDTPAVWEKIGGGGSEPEPTGELLFNGSVTTEEDSGDYIYAFDQNSLLLNYSSIIVELDGTRYTLERHSGTEDGVFAFGDDEDFSTYPLYLDSVIQVGGSVWDTYLCTAEAKTYSLKIWANSDPVEPSEPDEPWVPN